VIKAANSKEIYKRDLQKRPTDRSDVCKQRETGHFVIQVAHIKDRFTTNKTRPTEEIVKRDKYHKRGLHFVIQVAHIKDVVKTDLLRTRPTEEMSKETNSTKEAYTKRPTKKTYKKDQQKRPTKKERQKRLTK